MIDRVKGHGFWRVGLVVLGIITLLTIISGLTGTKGDDTLIEIPLFPGFIIYVLVTGDIHGWQPGPIGQVGRLFVTALGSWLFWTPMVYWIYKRVKKTNR